MDSKIIKLYAAYRSGCLGDNIIHVYFPFLANIIIDEKWNIVDELKVAEKFSEKYSIPLPINFVRQVLGVGVENKEIVYNQGKYIAQFEKLKPYGIDNSDFNSYWNRMLEGFSSYCQSESFDLSGIDIEACVFRFLDEHDEDIISNDELYMLDKSDSFNFIWHGYLKTLSEKDTQLFDFMVSLNFCNILKDTVFYSSDTVNPEGTYRGLIVYLDSPIIFALLGIDSPERIESCKLLVSEMQKAGCTVQIFDHNFAEIKGIMERAVGWAISQDYDIREANNVSRYFHDVLVDAPAISEFCESSESKLNELGITVKNISYNSSQHEFQEDEDQLFSMIENRYTQNGRTLSDDKKYSIKTDVRSIIMIYRERRGQVSTRIQTSGHIFITLNGSIANVSKNFESNCSLNSGHIPACISADLFGSILWLFTPVVKMEYQRKQLLADCFVALRPSKEMLTKYIDTLVRARNADEIDEKKFLFMRSHMAVNDALMNVTKGEYARFNDLTYQDVYEEIVAVADKKYTDEVRAHDQTKKQLDDIKQEMSVLSEQVSELQSMKSKRDRDDFDSKCKKWGWIISLIVVGIPYIILITIIEITKSAYNQLSISSIIRVGLLILSTIIAGIAFVKIKTFIFAKVRKHFTEKQKNNSL